MRQMLEKRPYLATVVDAAGNSMITAILAHSHLAKGQYSIWPTDTHVVSIRLPCTRDGADVLDSHPLEPAILQLALTSAVDGPVSSRRAWQVRACHLLSAVLDRYLPPQGQTPFEHLLCCLFEQQESPKFYAYQFCLLLSGVADIITLEQMLSALRIMTFASLWLVHTCWYYDEVGKRWKSCENSSPSNVEDDIDPRLEAIFAEIVHDFTDTVKGYFLHRPNPSQFLLATEGSNVWEMTNFAFAHWAKIWWQRVDNELLKLRDEDMLANGRRRAELLGVVWCGPPVRKLQLVMHINRGDWRRHIDAVGDDIDLSDEPWWVMGGHDETWV
uniref:Uncharacterized protein n=1 Tax=Microdochium trichocladiopsis TaxID=1682393 RepID=A0A9P8XTX5_9PEZI|nr:uncharacterized protein B0I36DRAFT_398279 [Microdochium trichocladiopsis]KAH7014511.1 hypothetical protein B0I36DRAFT_398279 [Microdochium trichocladiopsis]